MGGPQTAGAQVVSVRPYWQEVLLAASRDRTAQVAVAWLAIMTALALSANALGSLLGVDAITVDLDGVLQPVLSGGHILGTDELGRDVLLRLLMGARVSLAVALAAAMAGTLLGTAVGMAAGWLGGVTERVVMRLVDALLGVPVLPLLILLSALQMDKVADATPWSLPLLMAGAGGALTAAWGVVTRQPRLGHHVLWTAVVLLGLGAAALVALAGIPWKALQQSPWLGVWQTVVLVSALGWMGTARLARAVTRQIKTMPYVEAARALGGTSRHILWVHVLPGVMAPVGVAATLEVGTVVLFEAALSFLGLGVRPPLPSWGNMLTHAQDYAYRAPLLALWPGLCILLTVVAVNTLGDALRDASDPARLP